MPKKLFRIIFGNFWLKALSLLLALVIWYGARMRIQEQTRLSVSLEVLAPQGFQTIYQSADRVELRVSGPSALVSRLARRESFLRMSATVDRESLVSGEVVLTVAPSWLNIMEGELAQLRVLHVEPASVRVVVSEVKQKRLPVEVRWTGEPGPGYKVAGVTPMPPEVLVRGPAVLLDAMSAIETEKVPVWNLREDQTLLARLVREHAFTLEGGQKVELVLSPPEPAQVLVTVNVASRLAEKTLEGIAVDVLQPPGFPYRIEVPAGQTAVRVVLSAAPMHLGKITRDSVRAFVRVHSLSHEQIEPGGSPRYREKVLISPPRNVPVTVRSVEPEEITIILRNPAE